MQSEKQRQPELNQENLKNLVNQVFSEMGSSMRYKKVKETVPGCESLLGKKIVMVDDVKEVLESFVEDLVVASGGNASFILHKDQLLDELVNEILQRNPDVVLVDGNLAKNIKGDMVIEQLDKNNINAKSIIFSSDSHMAAQLKSKNITFVKKETHDPESSIRDVAGMVK